MYIMLRGERRRLFSQKAVLKTVKCRDLRLFMSENNVQKMMKHRRVPMTVTLFAKYIFVTV